MSRDVDRPQCGNEIGRSLAQNLCYACQRMGVHRLSAGFDVCDRCARKSYGCCKLRLSQLFVLASLANLSAESSIEGTLWERHYIVFYSPRFQMSSTETMWYIET